MKSSPRPHDNVVYTEFDDAEAVLVDLDTKRYYTLNETAMVIWRQLEEGRTQTEIVSDLTQLYEVTSEHANASVEKLLNSLTSHRLLRTDG